MVSLTVHTCMMLYDPSMNSLRLAGSIDLRDPIINPPVVELVLIMIMGNARVSECTMLCVRMSTLPLLQTGPTTPMFASSISLV